MCEYPGLILDIGTLYSPTKSLEEVESKSLTQNRRMATSVHLKGKEKFSFQTGLKPLFLIALVLDLAESNGMP